MSGLDGLAFYLSQGESTYPTGIKPGQLSKSHLSTPQVEAESRLESRPESNLAARVILLLQNPAHHFADASKMV